jgi:hypothetical protein
VSPKKRRKGRRAPRHPACRRHEPLSIVSTRVLDGSEPVRVVAHNGDGSWQFLDGKPVDVDHLISTHAHHLFDEFPVDLAPLVDLPVGRLAERYGPGFPWRIEAYVEE